jgi:hypothetical protein
MQLRLNHRYALTIFLLIISTVLALTWLFLFQFQKYTNDISKTASGIMAQTMLDQTKEHTNSKLILLAANLVIPLYRMDMEAINEMISSAKNQREILEVIVFDHNGRVLHDGTRIVEVFGKPLDYVVVKQALETHQVVYIQQEDQLHAAVSIRIGDELLGGVLYQVAIYRVISRYGKLVIEAILFGSPAKWFSALHNTSWT